MPNVKEQALYRSIDKDYCLSSYLAFRFIPKEGIDFFPNSHHPNFSFLKLEERTPVKTSQDIDKELQNHFNKLYQKYDKIGILLSGGMDSAILASYLKPDSNAYTLDTDISEVFKQEVKQAKKYCQKFNLNHHTVKLSIEDCKRPLRLLMEKRGAPLHSIDPQIYKAALMAKENGDEIIVVGENADLTFGGLDKLVSKDWTFDEFVKRFTFLDPNKFLKTPVDISETFEKYRINGDKIDFVKFLNEIFYIEGLESFTTAMEAAGIPYTAPYANLTLDGPLDLERVRSGESKYLIRELFAQKYPNLIIPEKVPMPRPVDKMLENWSGPTRPEFREDINIDKISGNQKWQLWCSEQFLNLFDPEIKK